MQIENAKGTLMDLLQTVQDQAARQADFLAPTKDLQFNSGKDSDGNSRSEIILERNAGMPTTFLDVNPVAFDQIASNAGIEVRTARRLRDGYAPEFDALINQIWQKESKTRMVRAHLDSGTQTAGTARAFVSDKFKTFDNHHLLNAALPQLMESPAQWQIVNAHVTDQRMNLRLKSSAITGEGAAVGDLMALGIGLGNSETGCGSVSVFQIFWTLACLNGMQTQNKSRSSHITSARGDGDTWSILTDEAKDADNHALELKVRDTVTAYASRESFDDVLAKMRAAGADQLGDGATYQSAADNLGRVLKLTKKETASVLDGLIETLQQDGYRGRPVSRATMVNAVTAAAHNAEPDSINDWQERGGRVLDLKPTEWAIVAQAA